MDPRPSRRRRRASGRDWYFQQLIKLAAVERSPEPAVLLLDADVFAVQPFSDDEMIRAGHALRPREPRVLYPDWLADAATTLGLPALDYQAAVTPCVLVPEAVRLLAQYVEAHVPLAGPRLRAVAKVPALGARARTWRGRLLGHKWTEYQLYDTFLVRQRLFDHFHFSCSDTVFSGNEVHQAAEFAAWTPGVSRGGPNHFFSLMQTRASIPVDDVCRKLTACGIL